METDLFFEDCFLPPFIPDIAAVFPFVQDMDNPVGSGKKTADALPCHSA
jgi:hypothetical protein